MFPILQKEQLSADVYSMWIHAPLIAEERRAGQFIILQIDEQFGERIPLTIADADPEKGAVRIIFQAVGASTKRLAMMHEGDALPVFLGPLGQPTHIEKKGTVVCVGGGIGVAPMHPIAQAMKRAVRSRFPSVTGKSRHRISPRLLRRRRPFCVRFPMSWIFSASRI